MTFKFTFLKSLMLLFTFSLILASCGSDEGEDDTPPPSGPTFKAEIDMLGYLETELNFDKESFAADFDRDFSIGGADFDEEEELPTEAKGAFAFMEDGLLGIMSVSYDGADTSNLIFSVNPLNGIEGSYDLIFDINIFDEEEELPQGQGDVLYLSSKLPEEFLFLYFFGGLIIEEGKGSFNITEYNSEAKTISGNFTFTYTLDAETDNGPVVEEAIKVTSGTFTDIPILE